VKFLKKVFKNPWNRWAKDLTFNMSTGGGYSAVKSVMPGGVIHETITGNKARRAEQLDAERREQEYSDPINQRGRLEDAGINPLFGGISSGSSGVEAPGVQGSNPLDHAMNLATLSHTMASTRNLGAQNKLLAEQTREASAAARIATHNAGVVESRPGAQSHESAYESIARGAVSSVRGAINRAGERANSWRQSIDDKNHPNRIVRWINNR